METQQSPLFELEISKSHMGRTARGAHTTFSLSWRANEFPNDLRLSGAMMFGKVYEGNEMCGKTGQSLVRAWPQEKITHCTQTHGYKLKTELLIYTKQEF